MPFQRTLAQSETETASSRFELVSLSPFLITIIVMLHSLQVLFKSKKALKVLQENVVQKHVTVDRNIMNDKWLSQRNITVKRLKRTIKRINKRE